MATAKIETLIDKVDGFELVRDQIAGILLVECDAQQQLAKLAGKDPTPWALRIFTERSNPWSEFVETPDEGSAAAAPIVNVSFDTDSFDMAMGNVVDRQQALGVFNIDCYGYGISAQEVLGHSPGDEKSAFEAQRAMRLVRNILLAAHYTYLGLRGLVGRRWPQSRTMFQPSIDGHPVQHVAAVRLALQVWFNEFSPQVQGQPLELISVQFIRQGTGQLLLRADYPQE